MSTSFGKCSFNFGLPPQKESHQNRNRSCSENLIIVQWLEQFFKPIDSKEVKTFHRCRIAWNRERLRCEAFWRFDSIKVRSIGPNALWWNGTTVSIQSDFIRLCISITHMKWLLLVSSHNKRCNYFASFFFFFCIFLNNIQLFVIHKHVQ